MIVGKIAYAASSGSIKKFSTQEELNTYLETPKAKVGQLVELLERNKLGQSVYQVYVLQSINNVLVPQKISSDTDFSDLDLKIVDDENDEDKKYLVLGDDNDDETEYARVVLPAMGGGGGTTDYAQLSNKPTINNVELSGNKTLDALGINAGSVGFDETGTYTDGSIGAVVSNQKKAINDLYDGIHTEIVNWEHGRISQDDGQNVNPAQTSRARTIGYISTDYAITVDRTTIAYEVYIYYYDANKDFVFRTSGYRDSAIAPNKNYAYYRINILNSSAQTATIDVSRLKTDITFVKKLTFDSQDIYTQVGVFTDRSLFKRNTVGRGAGGIFVFENSQTRIATNPVVRTTAKSYRITPTTGYKYIFYTCSDETHLDPEYSQQVVWRTEENTFKISDNINYVILIIAKTDNSAIYTDDFDKVTVTAEETVQYAINDVYAKIAEPKDDDLLPNYWKEYFNTKETALESADIGLGFNGVSLAFITDIHLGTNNKISPLLLKYITTHTNVRYVVCGGDIVTNFSTKDVALSELNWWMQKTSGLDIVNLHGNHDGNSNNQPDNTQIISDAEFYGLCCRQSENVVNWEHNSLFGYRDNQAQKMRFIYLDTGAPDSVVISNAQIEWMQGKISELPTGWFVLVFCHQFWTGVSKSTSTLPLDANGTKILNALETIYDTANATICGVIVGHCHRNYSLISAKGFPVIATTCDTSGTGSSIYDPDTPNRTSETTEEQVIDLFYVNTSARTINTIRIGDGDTEQDRSFTF